MDVVEPFRPGEDISSPSSSMEATTSTSVPALSNDRQASSNAEPQPGLIFKSNLQRTLHLFEKARAGLLNIPDVNEHGLVSSSQMFPSSSPLSPSLPLPVAVLEHIKAYSTSLAECNAYLAAGGDQISTSLEEIHDLAVSILFPPLETTLIAKATGALKKEKPVPGTIRKLRLNSRGTKLVSVTPKPPSSRKTPTFAPTTIHPSKMGVQMSALGTKRGQISAAPNLFTPQRTNSPGPAPLQEDSEEEGGDQEFEGTRGTKGGGRGAGLRQGGFNAASCVIRGETQDQCVLFTLQMLLHTFESQGLNINQDHVLPSRSPHRPVDREATPLQQAIKSAQYTKTALQKGATEAYAAFSTDFFDRLLLLLQQPYLGKAQRQCLMAVIHAAYRRFLGCRSHFRASFTAFIATLRGNPDVRCLGVSEVLQIIGSILKGLAVPVSQPHHRLLNNILLPLHSVRVMVDEVTPVLTSFHESLTYCVLTFVEKDPSVCETVVEELLKAWDERHAKQGVLLLNELEQVLEHRSSADPYLGSAATNLVKNLVKRGVGSVHFAIAERALMVINNDSVLSILLGLEDKKNILKMLLDTLTETCERHWNETCRQMSFHMLAKLFSEDKNVWQSSRIRLLRDIYEKKEKEEKEAQAMRKLRMGQKRTNLTMLDFVFGRVLGEGSYSRVWHCKRISRDTSQRYWEDYAMKIMNVELLKQQNYEVNARMEVKLLTRVLDGHPNIIDVLGHFEDRERLCILLEYASRGDVFHLLDRYGTTDVLWTRFMIAEVTSALLHIHAKGYAYLDLKPENLLLNEDGHVKVTDFATARRVDGGADDDEDDLSDAVVKMEVDGAKDGPGRDGVDNEQEGGLVAESTAEISPHDGGADDGGDGASGEQLHGTAEYLSPELIDGCPATRAADLWALGCLLFQCLAGRTPFWAETVAELYEQIRRHGKEKEKVKEGSSPYSGSSITFPKSFPAEAKDLVLRLMHPDPLQRLGMRRLDSGGGDGNGVPDYANDVAHGYKELTEHAFFDGLDFSGLATSTPPEAKRGALKPQDISMKLRQRKYSMLLTDALPKKYSYDKSVLDTVDEEEEYPVLSARAELLQKDQRHVSRFRSKQSTKGSKVDVDPSTLVVWEWK
eukprot:TRINITY_DN5705_c0_g1_i2.p1 TRINITY_DN5705_c0_g1~~TRINITY_DN5705_c0_g1_i2.p1  ORF type:complete len:1123 (+),score=240.42 TRINITY_DN5705_c0_g1_i2:65-3433(+)